MTTAYIVLDMAQNTNQKVSKSSTPLYFCRRVSGEDFDKNTYMIDRILLIKIMGGSVRVRIGGREYNLTSHNFVFIPPHTNIHVVKASVDMDAVVIGFMMALQEMTIQKLGHSFFMYVFERLVWQLSDMGECTLNAFCTLFENHCKKEPDVYSADIANSLFNVFLLSFYHDVKDMIVETDVTSANSKSLAARFAFLLHENFKQHHTVGFYADKLCISSKYLTQILKANTGYTPKVAIDYSLGIEALFLLSNTSLNIQEISNQLGFPDQSYFGRFFKRLFGMSPLHYRAEPDMKLIERLREAKDGLDAIKEK